MLEVGPSADVGAKGAPKPLIPKAADADEEDEGDASSSSDDEEVRVAGVCACVCGNLQLLISTPYFSALLLCVTRIVCPLDLM